jgi:hypothetical protein
MAPGVAAVSSESRRSEERPSCAQWKPPPPARQQVFSTDLVSSAIDIFEQRLGRSVSDGEARMLLARLVDFVRLGVNGSGGTPADTRKPDGPERGGGV